MKRVLALVMALMLLTALLPTLAVAEAPIELVIWGGVPGENGPDALCEAFNAENNGKYHATYYRFVNDDSGNTKLDTALLSGEQIDIFFTYTVANIDKRSNGNMMADLAALGAEDWIKETMVDGALQYYNDKLVTIPTNYEPQIMFLNKDMFDAAGIEIPKSWTLDEYREIAKKLTTADTYGAYSYRYGRNYVQDALGANWWYNEDGTASGFNNETAKNIMNTFYEMDTLDKSSYPYSEILSLGISAYPQDLIINGKVAIIESSYWFLRYFKNLTDYAHDFITAFAPIPTVTEDGYNHGAMNNYISISESCKNKEAAWEFVKYWIAGGYDKLYVGGKIPLVKSGVDNEKAVVGLLGENAEKLFDVDSFLNIFNSTFQFSQQTVTTAFSEIEQIYNEETDNLFLGATDMDTYMSTVDTRITQAIQDAN